MRIELVAAFAVSAALGCGSSSSGGGGGGAGGSDAGSDTAPDGGSDASADAPLETAGDAASEDAGSDAGRQPVFDCVGSVTWPAPSAANATFALTFWDLVGTDVTGPFPGALVEACAADDTACSAPVSSGTTGAMGTVSLTVPTPGTGWSGFMRITSSSTVPSLLFLNPPIWYDGVRWGGPWGLADDEDLDALAGSGITRDTAKGTVLVLTADCCYLVRGAAPGCSASDTSELEVTLNGLAADGHTKGDYAYLWFNVDPGTVHLEGKIRSTGEVAARSAVRVVAGAFTQTVLAPTPL